VSVKPMPFLVLDSAGKYDLAHDGLQVLIRRVSASSARVIGYFAFSKSAMVQRIREEGIVVMVSAQGWIERMPDSLRGWDPTQADSGGIVGASL